MKEFLTQEQQIRLAALDQARQIIGPLITTEGLHVHQKNAEGKPMPYRKKLEEVAGDIAQYITNGIKTDLDKFFEEEDNKNA